MWDDLTLLYVARLDIRDGKLYLRMPAKVVESYPHIYNDYYFKGFKAIWLGTYSDAGRVVFEPYEEVELKKDSYYDESRKEYVHCINVTDLVRDKGIGKGYAMELLLLDFIHKEPDKEEKEIAIFPEELRTDIDYSVPSEIRRRVEKERRFHEEISSEIEAVTLLRSSGLQRASEELRLALIKYREQDWEASIMRFRKVIEELRQLVDKKEVRFGEVKKRQEIMKSIIHTTYSLLSNFGQHVGTQGRKPEAKLAKELTIALVHYIMKYYKSGVEVL